MALQITLLLKHGWENLWKNRVLWLFSGLVLVEPLLRLIIPVPNSESLASSISNLVVNLVALYFTILSIAGVAFVAYHTAIGSPVDFQTAFQASKRLFWRVVGISFLLAVFLLPYFCILGFSFNQILRSDIRYNFFFIPIFLSIFTAMWYFPVIESIATDSKVGESLKTAWTIFIRNFVSLTIISLLLVILLRVIGIASGMVMILVQNNFDVSALGKLDYLSPHLSFPKNNLYELVTAILQTMWQTYSASIFTFAYLKYSGATMQRHSTAQFRETA
jgi:hypothetical protein